MSDKRKTRSYQPHLKTAAFKTFFLLLRMLGPHMWLQLALTDKLLGQAAQRRFPAVTAHAWSSRAPAACPSWQMCADSRAAPRLHTRASQLFPSLDRHCACLVLMCASSMSFLAKVRGQAAQRHASALECVSSLFPPAVTAHAWSSRAPAACPF